LEGLEGIGLVSIAFVAVTGVLAVLLVWLDPVVAIPPACAVVPPPMLDSTLLVAAGTPVFEAGAVELSVPWEKPAVTGALPPDDIKIAPVSTASLPFVKILISWVAPSDHVFVKTMTVMFASITPLAVEPTLRVITPPDEIDTVPFSPPDDPLLASQTNEHVPSWLIVRVSFSHHGAPGPEAKPLPCHVPTRLLIEYEVVCLVKTRRPASSAVFAAPFVPTVIVSPGFRKEA
jgi:hypothetical protein